MFNKIAIIPARSGSKSLHDKNILNLCGKPMIAYSIEAAIQSNMFNEVFVSTDSEKYAEISMNYGANVLMRRRDLASDSATTFDVLEDILNNFSVKIDYFMLLQPTSPLRTSKHIIEAINNFEDKIDKFDFLASVKEADHPPQFVKIIDDDKSLKYFDFDYSNYRRQDFCYYSPNGAIFIAKPNEYLHQKHFFGKRSLAYIMDEESSLDVDTSFDFKMVESCIENFRKEK